MVKGMKYSYDYEIKYQEVDGKKKAMLMAFSPCPVSDGNGCRALLGGEE